ncbi:MAG: diguanylate cyclase domain-containing protein [Solirubrobacterales bacterium]
MSPSEPDGTAPLPHRLLRESSAVQPAETFSLATMRSLFAAREHPYSGVFLDEPRRIGGVMCLAMAAIAVPLALASPPTEAIGQAGWIVAAGIAAINLVTAYLLLRPGSRIGFNGMLAITYVGVAQVAAVTWLAGGQDTPYHLLYLGPGVLPPAIHPPRRAVTLLGAITLALFLPLAYNGWNGEDAAEMGLEAAFIWMLALITMAVMGAVREQRLVLLSEGEAANRLARRDDLTGLGNRRSFDEALEREIARSRRSGGPVSVVVIDLDRFKSINDRFGHLEGDRALQATAEALLSTLRLPDSCFRWGGDEFALLLPDSPRDGAAEVGERVREVLAGGPRLPNGEAIGLSFGVAQLAPDETADEMLHRADAALFEQKRAHGVGRASAPSA